MGYLPLNLTILQLPAPSSSMTKAEYKQAYGIDLDAIDIKAFRLVVFGQEKYAIDQIKEVEDGIEIYFNGRIMSITDTVQVSDEVYDVTNGKPLYFHPINYDIKRGDDVVGRCAMFIINNSATKFTSLNDVIAHVRSWELDEVLLLANGGLYTSNSKDIVLSVFRITQQTAGFYGYSITDHSYSNAITLDGLTFTGFTDGVNKIN